MVRPRLRCATGVLSKIKILNNLYVFVHRPDTTRPQAGIIGPYACNKRTPLIRALVPSTLYFFGRS
jgi:hypothetical protein